LEAVHPLEERGAILPTALIRPRRRGRFVWPALAVLAVLALAPPAGAADRDLVRLAGAPATDGAPVCVGYRIVQPGSSVRNGDLVEFFSYWQGADSVRADFSRLDATATAPVAGTYVGDSSVVENDQTHLWSAFWFTFRIASFNPRDDAVGIPVVITGTAAGGGPATTSEALAFCLSNHPPRNIRTEILRAPERFVVDAGDTLYPVRNGDSLRIETTWSFHSSPLSIEADFAALDDSFTVGRVYYELLDAPAETLQTVGVYYELNGHAKGATTAVLPVRITGSDGGCGRAEVTLRVQIDNVGPTVAPVITPLPSTVATPTLAISGTLAGEAGATDVLVAVNQGSALVCPLPQASGTLTFSGTLTLQPGTNHIVAYARDLVGNRSAPSAPATVDYLYAPEFKGWRVLQPDTLGLAQTATVPVRNDDVILLHSYWDARAPYALTADFGALDTAFDPAAVHVSQVENVTVPVGETTEVWAAYQIEYHLSAQNARADGKGIVVPLTAFDPATGFETTTESLDFCLNNDPPRLLAARYVGSPQRWVVRDGDSLFTVRNGGTVLVETEWTRGNWPYALTFDFSDLDADFVRAYVQTSYVDTLSTDSTAAYRTFYEFSTNACCAEGKDPYPLPATVTASEVNGCGEGSGVLWFEMDNAGPAGSPTFDTPPPASVTADSLDLAGHAPEGSQTLTLTIEHVETDSTTTIAEIPLDAQRAFSVRVPLRPGENRITAWGVDAVGNATEPSLPVNVRRITGSALIDVPKLFRPGDRFTLESLAGWSSIVLEIYNLEGDLVRRWESVRPAQQYLAVTWDGRNGHDEEVRQGPYLLRIETRDPSGRPREEVKAFVFQR
jgi:hypothetical protein